MARTTAQHEERKAEVVAAATATFARLGYAGTTTKQLAADVAQSTGRGFTPALLYHYFPGGKLELFAAVMRQFGPLRAFGRALREDADALPEVYLPRVARIYLQTLEDPTAASLLRIVITEGPRHPELAENLVGYVAPLFVLPLAEYLQRQAELGRFRPLPPLAAIFEFLGPLMTRALIGQLLGDTPLPLPLPDAGTLVEHHVRTFLHGVTNER
jgi:AcrR family transcriptional regulator